MRGNSIFLSIAAAAAIALAGCGTSTGDRLASGALIGAAGGAAIGAMAGNPGLGAAAGAVAGGAIGANIGGRSGTIQDVQRCETVPAAAPSYWDVTYRFRGLEHRVQLTNQPGATILVNDQGEPRV